MSNELPPPEGIVPVIDNTLFSIVTSIKEDTTQLTKYQKALLEKLGVDTSTLINKLQQEYSENKTFREATYRENTYRRKMDEQESKARQGYMEFLEKIYGANSEVVDRLTKAYDISNKTNIILESMHGDYVRALQGVMQGDSKEAQGARRSYIRGEAAARDKTALGDFFVGMAEKTGFAKGGGLLPWVLQRFAGQSVKGRAEDRKYKEQHYGARNVSEYTGAAPGAYDKLVESLDLTRRAKVASRNAMLNAMMPGGSSIDGGGGKSPKGQGLLTDGTPFGGTSASRQNLAKLPSWAAVPALVLLDALTSGRGGAGAGAPEKSKMSGGVKGVLAALGVLGAGILVARGKLGAVIAGVGKALSKMGPLFTKMGPAFSKAVGGVVKKLPLIGAAIQVVSTAGKVIGIQKDKGLSKQEKTVRSSMAIGGGVGALGGAAAGAAIGSIVPVVGTAIGGILGAIVGGLAGDYAGTAVGKKVGEKIAGVQPKKYHSGGVVTQGGNMEVDAKLEQGEVVLPRSIAPLYQQIAVSTTATAAILKKDVMEVLRSIEELLGDIKGKVNVAGFPGATRVGSIGG